jgi:hypothetical protein
MRKCRSNVGYGGGRDNERISFEIDLERIEAGEFFFHLRPRVVCGCVEGT